MITETGITINIAASTMLIGIGVFFSALIAVVWKGKTEIAESIKDALKPLKNNVKVISDYLINSALPFDHTKLEAYSPLKVTAVGEQYLSAVGFAQVFSDHKEAFYEYIEREDPKNDYDIENAAIRSVLQLFQEEYFFPVKNYFYNNPNEDKNSFFRVAGVFVRDKYMSRSRASAGA